VGKQVISGAQIRAGRNLLGLSSKQFAEVSGVGWATIKRFELVDGVPPSRGGTLERVQAALEASGIEFLGDPVASPGVRLRRA
jgi:transcriptional regulator with XRE-family HTH domain